MSVALLAPEEIASIVGSFARYAEEPTDPAKLDTLAEVFAAVNADAIAHKYREEAQPVRVTRGMIAAARLNPLDVDALIDAIRHYRNQVCEHPAWASSPVATALESMITFCEKGTTPAIIAARTEAARRREEARQAKLRAQEGSKYQATKDESRTQLAARIRADIKAAVKAGTLPRASYSVRTRNYSGGGSIDVTIDELPFCTWRIVEDVSFGRSHGMTVKATAEAEAVRAAVREIVAAYNYDRSDIMTDYFNVRFHSDVTLGDDEERAALYGAACEENRGELDRAREAEAL